MERLEVRLFGHFEARVDGAPVEMPMRQTALLLALLALEPDRAISRASLAALLWPSRGEEQARTSLRQALYRLRTALAAVDPFPLEIGPRWVRLRAEDVEIDASALAAAGDDPEALERALQRISGLPLEGLEAAEDELETRLTTERARLRRQLSDAMGTLSEARLAERRFPDVEALARRRLGLDAFDEGALRDLMSALAHQGRRNAALEAYQQAAERLRRELSVAPQQETTALWQEIRQDRARSAESEPQAEVAETVEPAPAERVEAEPPAGAPHMRHVAVLHMAVPRLQAALMDPDPEAADAAARSTLDRIVAAATRAGGVRIGGSGAELAFEFGTSTQESPALSAALLALDLRDLEPSCGVHAGDGLSRTEGRVAQIARRLALAAAPGEVRLGPEAMAECRGALDVAEATPLDLPSDDARLRSWIVRGSGARAGWAARRARGLSRFVGRDEEMAELERNAARAAAGGRVVVLIGEAGLGKSRLVHEFLARQDGVRVHRADFAQLGSGSGLVTLGTLVRTWLDLPDETPARQVMAAADDRLRHLGAGAELLPAIAVILGLSDGAGDWATGSVERRRHLLAETIRLLLTPISDDAKTILVVEDAHWADAESADTLGHLVATLGAAQVLMIVTCRPEFRQDWIRLPHVREIRLEGLDADAAAALVASLADGKPRVRALEKRLSEGAGGVPLYIEEVLRALEDTGDPGPPLATGTRDADGLRIPPSIRGVLSLRIDRLAERERHVLQAAAIIGPTPSADMLAELTALGEDDLAAALDALAEADLLLRTGSFPARRLAFKHALTLEAAYRSIVPSRRQAMHRAMLELCGRIYAGDQHEHVEEMADHARFGGMWSDAADLCKRAAIQAEGRSSYHRAALLYDRALAALQRQPQSDRLRLAQADIYCRMRPSLWMTGEYDRIVKGLARADQMTEKAGDQRLLAEIRAQRAYFHSTDGRFEDGLELCRTADAAARQIDDALLHAEIAAARCQLLRFRGKYRDAIQAVEKHLSVWTGENRHYRGLQLATRGVYVHSHLAACRGGLGQNEAARYHAETALAIARETARPADLYIATYHGGQVALDAGGAEEALRCFYEAFEIARTSDLFYFAIWAKPAIGEALLATGQIEAALKLLRDEKEGYAVVHELIRLQWLAALAKALTLAGDPAGAEATLLDVLKAARRMQQPHLEQVALRRLAVATASRDAPAAADSLRQAYAIATREGYAPDMAHTQSRAVEFGVDLHAVADADPEVLRNARLDTRGGRSS